MVLSFDKYVLAHPAEPVEFKRIVLFSTMDMPEKKEVQSNLYRIFDFCDDPDDYLSNKMFTALPVLFWDRQSLLDKYGVVDASMEVNIDSTYNSPHGIIVSKLDTLKILKKAGFPFLPKTYFTREEAASELKFPLIAKASNTFQSRGVEKIKNKKELEDLSGGFDIYQDQIEIDEEFRVVFFRGKKIGTYLIAAYRRDPLNDKAKDLRTNESGMYHERLLKRPKSNFSWTQVSPYKHKKLEIQKCYDIAAYIFKLNPTLNVAGLDIAVDNEGKHWFIESNSTPGLFSNMVPLIYKFMYEDYYGVLGEYAKRRIREMAHYFTDLTMKDEPTFKIENPNLLNHIDGFLPHFE